MLHTENKKNVTKLKWHQGFTLQSEWWDGMGLINWPKAEMA